MNISELIISLKKKGIHLSLNNGKLKINAPKNTLSDDLILKIKKNKEEIVKSLSYEESIATLINNPFIRYNRNAKRNVYCFPALIAFGIWCTPLADYLNDFKITSFNFQNKENMPSFYADLIINDSPLSDIIFLTYSAGGKLAFEVAKELESRNINVSDIIMIDVKKTINISAKKEDIEAMNVLKTLNKYKLDFLEERVNAVIYDYMRYTRGTVFSGVIKANIHHVIADSEDKNLASLTQGQYKEYKGIGDHRTMLQPPFLKDNAELINSILLKL